MRVYRVRVYADSDYRNQTLHWREQIQGQFERASTVTEAQFHVTLKVVSLQPWERQGSASHLENILGELKDQDAGAQADWVVGFVAPLRAFTATQHELGMAFVFGRHAVLRSIENLAEAANLNELLHSLPLDERERLFRERKQHKEAAILLHEWAHGLGAIHDRGDDALLSPVYDERQGAFSDESARLIELGLKHHTASEPTAADLRAWAREARALVSGPQLPGLDEKEKANLLARAEKILEAGALPEGPAWSEAERLRYNQAVTLFQKKQLSEANEELAPLVRARPERPQVLDLGCEIALQRRGIGANDLDTCTRATKVANASAEAPLRLAHLRMLTGDSAGAVETLHAARDRYESAPPDRAEVWLYLSSLLQQTWCVTWAEAAAAHLEAARAEEVRSWATHNRRVLGLPRAEHPAVAPEQESVFITRVRLVQQEAVAGHMDQAQKVADQLAKDFAQAPGAHAILCELHMRAGRADKAKAACERALKGDDDLVNAHHAMAVLGRTPAVGAKHALRAIALDPSREALVRQQYKTRYARELPTAAP